MKKKTQTIFVKRKTKTQNDTGPNQKNGIRQFVIMRMTMKNYQL